jgi:hypothetical protein
MAAGANRRFKRQQTTAARYIDKPPSRAEVGSSQDEIIKRIVSVDATLGTMADQNSNAVTISGGTISGVTNVNLAAGNTYKVNNVAVVGAPGAAVADAAGGGNVDTEARAALNALLARLRAHGLIAT